MWSVLTMNSLYPQTTSTVTETEKTANAILGSKKNPVHWPQKGKPLSEFKTQYLATMAFPALFVDSRGDATNRDRPQEVTLKEALKHYTKFADILPDGSISYRFAKHKYFSFWLSRVP